MFSENQNKNFVVNIQDSEFGKLVVRWRERDIWNTLFLQVFARIIASLNFSIPILSWIFIFNDKSAALNECLGKGYLNFLFSPTLVKCTGNQFGKILCQTWLALLSIFMSNVVDVFCIFYCFKHISKSTEEVRNMLSKQAYSNRKRYYQINH